MDDSSAWELLAERLGTKRRSSAAASTGHAVTVEGGATIARESDERSPGDSPSVGPHLRDTGDTYSSPFEEGDGDRLRRSSKRVRGEEAGPHRIGTFPQSGTHRGFESASEKNQPADGAAARFAAASVSEFQERVGLMFKTSNVGPTKSGREPMASEVSKGIMKMAWEVMDDRDEVPECLITVLSNRFGNFDRMVGCGWLLADAVGLPLPERADAYAVGLKARTQTGKLKAKIYEKTKADRAAARKLEDTDPKRQELLEEAARTEAALLCEPIELPFTRSAQAVSSATGSRKVAQEKTVSPLERRTAEAEAGCAQAAKALLKAQRTQEDAQKKYDAKGRVLDKWLKIINECRPQSIQKIQPSYEKALEAHERAKEASSEADQDALVACIEALQAENELLSCEKAASDALVEQMRAE